MERTESQPELEALRAVRSVVYPANADLRRHKERTMDLFTASKAVAQAPQKRWLWGVLALFTVGGLSYATGLSDIVSEWFVTVEPIDAQTDRVTLDHATDPDLGFTVDLPIDEAQDLVDAANNNELLVFEVLETDEEGAGAAVGAQLLVTPIDAPLTVEMIGADGTTTLVEAPTER